MAGSISSIVRSAEGPETTNVLLPMDAWTLGLV